MESIHLASCLATVTLFPKVVGLELGYKRSGCWLSTDRWKCWNKEIQTHASQVFNVNLCRLHGRLWRQMNIIHSEASEERWRTPPTAPDSIYRQSHIQRWWWSCVREPKTSTPSDEACVNVKKKTTQNSRPTFHNHGVTAWDVSTTSSCAVRFTFTVSWLISI